MLITFRPEFKPPWAGHAQVIQLPLNRLGRRQGAAIVERLTGGKALPDKVFDQIVAKTEGVPLFLEELTKTVLESGLLRDTAEHYELTGPISSLAIPATLHNSLMARLDRLAPVRDVAQTGATIGREFSHALLTAVAERPETELNSALDRLIDAELIFRRGTPAVYTFKHALVQDAGYESLLKSKRQQLHARVAQVLAEWLHKGLGPEPEVAAHHYTEAGLAVQAVTYWLHASQRARQRSADADADAVVHLTRGLEVLKALPDSAERTRQELQLQLALAQALFASRGYGATETAQAYSRAVELADTAGNLNSQFEAMYGVYGTQYFQGQHAAGLAAAVESLRLANRLGDSGALCVGHRNMAAMLNALGQFADAHIHAEKALGLYDAEKHRPLAIEFGHDVGVASLAHLSFAL